MEIIKQKRWFTLLALGLLFGLFLLLYKAPPEEWDKARELGEFIESKGALGVVIFFIVAALATSIGLPRQLFAFAAGFAYGVPIGVLTSSLAAICGCAITFYCSRRWLTGMVLARFPQLVASLNKLMRDDVFLKILVLRLQPLGTNLITNLCAGVTSLSAGAFLTSSWFGYLPQMLIFSLLGAGVRIGSNAYFYYSASVLLLSLVLGGWLYKRYSDHNA